MFKSHAEKNWKYKNKKNVEINFYAKRIKSGVVLSEILHWNGGTKQWTHNVSKTIFSFVFKTTTRIDEILKDILTDTATIIFIIS